MSIFQVFHYKKNGNEAIHDIINNCIDKSENKHLTHTSFVILLLVFLGEF